MVAGDAGMSPHIGKTGNALVAASAGVLSTAPIEAGVVWGQCESRAGDIE